MNIAIIGFGNVGRGFVNLWVARQETLAVEYGFAPKVIAILAKRGVALDPKGIDLNRDIAISPPPIQADAAIADADVVVELTPTDVQTGGPGLHHLAQGPRPALQLPARLNLKRGRLQLMRKPIVIAATTIAQFQEE